MINNNIDSVFRPINICDSNQWLIFYLSSTMTMATLALSVLYNGLFFVHQHTAVFFILKCSNKVCNVLLWIVVMGTMIKAVSQTLY